MPAFVLGSPLEDSSRRSLLIFDGDPTGFVTRPISVTPLAAFVVVALPPAILGLIKRHRAAREQAAARDRDDELV
ncbi:hypothetical protein AHOG_05245 [Actinoalloteichus hoggarensis]|uniref:Uncharacterized protein n=1 Tax=Actinoalloteichus hoggarensis TaxID=1470176 RepID=A0A221VYS9_9PSEU|nr:hypothetical protein AHOG_05245 [Actinoalloteichus hoggarensis]